MTRVRPRMPSLACLVPSAGTNLWPAVLVGGLGAILVLATSSPAHADDKQICIAAAEDGQQSRIDGKLKAAREQFLVCARSGCPSQVRRDCSQWMTEVMTALPTIVLGARDPDGRDVVVAKISIDGVSVADGLDGKPIEVDPGKHSVRFESVTFAPVEQQVLVREAEKGRPVTVQFAAAGAAEVHVPTIAPPPALAPSGDIGAPATRSGPSPWTWVLGGVGVVALGVGAYLEASVNSDASSLDSSCHSNCSHAQVDPLVLKQQVFGPIAFGVGGVSLGLATYYFFARPKAASAPKKALLRWGVMPSSRGAVGGVEGSF
jgi:hypothetical protein